MPKTNQPPSNNIIEKQTGDIQNSLYKEESKKKAGWLVLPDFVDTATKMDEAYEPLLSGSLKIEDEWMTTQEAADFLKVSPHSLRNMTSNGYIPYQKLLRRNRYLKSDLVRLLTSTRKGGFRGS